MYRWGVSNTSALSSIITGTNPANGQPIKAAGNYRAGDTFVTYATGFSTGVHSGDPLPARIMLWTRFQVPGDQSQFAAADTVRNVNYTYSYAPAAGYMPVPVTWWLGASASGASPLVSGTYTTDGSRDWTVKLDVQYPSQSVAGALLYYGFSGCYGATCYSSTVGSFRSIPASNVMPALNYAVVSCSNWAFGRYFLGDGALLLALSLSFSPLSVTTCTTC